MKYVLLLTLAILMSCSEENVSTDQVALEGQWVEVNEKTDTLAFKNMEGQKWINLSRGNEIRNGFSTPKCNSGQYEYELLEDEKIALRWVLSSNTGFKDYYFKQSGDRLIIDNFFEGSTTSARVTFEKLK